MSEKKDQLKEILKDQLNKEAKQIEEEVGLNDNEEIPNELKIRMKNALDQKIREREKHSEDMKRMDAYAELSEEDQEALRLGREMLKNQSEEKKIYTMRRKKRNIRRIAALAAVLILVMAVGMTSFGGPERMLQFMKSSVGDREVSQVDSSDKNKVIEEEDEEKAKQTAEELKELNDLRKTMTENGVKEALGQAFEYEAKGDKVLVLYLPECHESIAGIIAGRIKDRLNHPAFVLTDAKEGIKGSGRSIEGYSMFEEMMKVKEVFTKFGGHPMAAGCSLKKEKLQEFRKKINENCTLEKKDFAKKVQIDIDMPVDYITMDLIHQLSVLEPFGKENKKPLFAHRKLKVERVNVFGKNRNVIKLALKSSQGTRIDGMIFEDEDEFREKMGTAKYITCTYYPVINEYQGYKSLQINIQNYFFVEE